MSASWREMYQRMQRAREQAFDDSATSGDLQIDRVYSFFMFCYHLKDWIKKDPGVPTPVQDCVERFVESSDAIGLAGDITNGVKHYVRDEKHVRVDRRARLERRGDRMGSDFVLGISALGSNIVVTGDLGPQRARALVDECVAAWDDFLAANGLTP
jgi:hypothetical protein